MNQNNIGALFFQNFFNICKNIYSNIKQILTLFHNRQVIIRNNSKCAQDLVQHLTMLARNTYKSLDPCSFF